ncbi:MAG: ATP-binding protein [Planctomycetes bacterium]|nr:ATP-binding protein [Planctomycetota bacterium]
MRTVRVLGASLQGAQAELVTVEARFDGATKERTEVVLTGLPDPVIRESKGRLVCALEANGLHLPHGRLYLNLVPAGRRKSGESLDLPLLLAAACACGHFEPKALRGRLFLGELGIDGALHASPGGLAAALAAAQHGVSEVIAATVTAQEAAWAPGVTARAAQHVEQVLGHLVSPQRQLPPLTPSEAPAAPPAPLSLDEVRGQATAKFALAVAAAGGHGLLFLGAPGAGKSMLARRFATLLPEPTLEERLEITRVLSAAGRWPGGLARSRPFRAPHHTVSYAGLVGGGAPPAPGEITLAHCGVLFLDELPEFRREVLEALRQPLEEGVVRISRAGRQLELEARFQLLAAMNPCPCGYLGHPRTPCACPPTAVQRYRRRISGPLLDRIDLRIELAPPTLDELAPRSAHGARGEASNRSTHSTSATANSSTNGPTSSSTNSSTEPTPQPSTQQSTGRTSVPSPPQSTNGTSAAELAARVAAARARAHARQGAARNADLDAAQLDVHAPVSARLRPLLERAQRQRGLSARAVQSLRRVARTLADLDGADELTSEHLARALALRAALP